MWETSRLFFCPCFIKSDDTNSCVLDSNLLLFSFQIWREYDTDGSGFIEADELKVRKYIISSRDNFSLAAKSLALREKF